MTASAPLSEQALQTRLRQVLTAITRSACRLDELIESGIDDAALVEAHAGDVTSCGRELGQVIALAGDVFLEDGETTGGLMVAAGHALHGLVLYPLPPRGLDDTDRLALVIAAAVAGADGVPARRAVWHLLRLVGVSEAAPYRIDRERIIEQGVPGTAIDGLVLCRANLAWAQLVLEHGPLTCLAALCDEGGGRRVEEIATVLDGLDPAIARTLRRLGTSEPPGYDPAADRGRGGGHVST